MGIFQDKDALFGNLETVLANKGNEAQKTVNLHAPPERVKYLKDSSFDILNIANNHIMDLGVEGFYETLKTLSENNLAFIGASNKPEISYAILCKKGIKLGFLGYTEGGFSQPEKAWIDKIDQEGIIKDIKFIKPQCDIVIVSLHWGIENVFYPSPKQIELAHKLIDAGATVILGHHPHVIQGIERYRNGLIAYSLGNFQFDPTLSYSPNESFMLLIELTKDGLVSHEVIPIMINKHFEPVIPKEEDREKILSFMNLISQHLAGGGITENWWFEQIAPAYLSGNMRSWMIRIRKYGLKHLLQCIRWLISPFVIKCYLGLMRKKLLIHD